eukprot:5652237-Pleurochrysis_carterae.AAC.1
MILVKWCRLPQLLKTRSELCCAPTIASLASVVHGELGKTGRKQAASTRVGRLVNERQLFR